MTTRLSPVLYLSLFIALAGCKDPSKSVPAAQVDDKAPPAAATKDAPKAAAAGIALSAENTTIGFVGSKVTGSHDGGFKSLSGTLTMGEKLVDSRASITIDMTSVFTDSEKLTGHLQSPDFFDVEKFPTATFEITSVEEKKTDAATHSLSGSLTLHGVTKDIAFPATLASADGTVSASAEFSINRQDFGIVYPGKKDDLIRDGVVIKLEVAAKAP